jgi:ATP-binding cassette, subfamily B, bacterial HlyB/CyaB
MPKTQYERDLVSFLKQVSIFSVYQEEELNAILQSSTLKSLNAGEVLFNQGDHGDTFYVVYSGRIRVIMRDEDGKEINLGVLTKGDHFGESALITNTPRNAGARAAEDCVLLEIEQESFYKYVLSNKEQRKYFDTFLRSTSIQRFLKSCTELSVVPALELKRFVGSFSSEHFKAGEAVFRQGAPPDKFYLIESGKIKVARWEDGTEEIVNFLHEGDFFGEKALIEQSERNADIVCLTDCHLYSLSAERFEELVSSSLKLTKVIEDRIVSYRTNKPPIPYRDLIKQELAGLKSISVSQESREEKRTEESRKGHRRPIRHRIVFPFIRQLDEMSCGPTCIMMIAKYHGKRFSSSRIRDLAHVDLSGASLDGLASAAEKLGFATRAMRFELTDLSRAALPCIVHWQGFHFVIVYRITDRHVYVADPAIGLKRYSRDEFVENWNGITLLIEPTPELYKQEDAKSSLKNFLPFVTQYKLILAEVFAASILLNLFGLATPIFTQNIIDNVLGNANLSLLNMMFIGMIVILVFQVIVGIIRQYLIVHTSMKIDLRMLVSFFKHLLSLPLGYYKVRKIGDFVTRFGENQTIRNFLTNTALTLLLDSILIGVYLALMFHYNVSMTLIVLLFIPVFIAVTLVFTPTIKRRNIESFNTRAESDSHLIETINAIDTVKAGNSEHKMRWRWENKYIDNLNADFRLFSIALYFHSFGGFVAGLTSVVLLWYGAHHVINGGLSLGQLMAFMVLMGSVIGPINRIVGAWTDVQQVLTSVERLNDVFSAKPEFPTSANAARGLVLTQPEGEIELSNVYFRYGGSEDRYILSNINLKVLPGQTVAIVGRSGSGKSTLVRLLTRLYNPTEGRVTLDGIDVKNIDLGCLRKLVGFVIQEAFVFNATIRENISQFDTEESIEKVMEAARLANADDFIANLGMGYETRIGESGIQLSGGQKQRIAIARVLYNNPKVLVFDEATSSLDTESEQAIQRNLGAILSGKTAIVIAHRLSTVRNADAIVVLDNGQIVERGTHEELIEKRGLYHYLSHQQLNV